MTPEKAQELRDEATPWPWEVRYTEIAFELSDGDTVLIGDPADKSGHLIAAAPELAELVAGLRYEYAIQKLDGDEWKLTDLDGRALESYASEQVTWWADPIPYSDITDRGPGWRVVRRLVGDPEVVPDET